MASITAVELGADNCALARTVVNGEEVQLLAAETLDPVAFPGIDAFTKAVKRTRRTLHLPRRCRAVVWGLPDGSNRSDPAIKPLLDPLIGAGFRIERAMSPCNALAALARLRMPRGEGATCWLAVNRSGVAIVVVRPGKQLYSHSFAWDSNVGLSGSQARLLQRYSLVAFLAPEIRRAMAAAREKGTPVDAIVTCGNLPEIRSLTMPLIEELDVEVESLDSLEGLTVKPELTDTLAEVAASIRLACAGAVARPTRKRDAALAQSAESLPPWVLWAAGVIVGVGVLAAGWMAYRPKVDPNPAPVAKKSPSPPAQQQKPVTQPPVRQKPGATPAAHAAATPPKPTTPAAQTPKPAPAAHTPAGTLNRPPAPADKHEAATPLLKEPIPRVTAILISNDRKLATIEGGRIVGVGDVLGSRTVVGIDDRAVTLREPSGVQIRVGLGGRVLGVNRSLR